MIARLRRKGLTKIVWSFLLSALAFASASAPLYGYMAGIAYATIGMMLSIGYIWTRLHDSAMDASTEQEERPS